MNKLLFIIAIVSVLLMAWGIVGIIQEVKKDMSSSMWDNTEDNCVKIDFSNYKGNVTIYDGPYWGRRDDEWKGNLI